MGTRAFAREDNDGLQCIAVNGFMIALSFLGFAQHSLWPPVLDLISL